MLSVIQLRIQLMIFSSHSFVSLTVDKERTIMISALNLFEGLILVANFQHLTIPGGRKMYTDSSLCFVFFEMEESERLGTVRTLFSIFSPLPFQKVVPLFSCLKGFVHNHLLKLF